MTDEEYKQTQAHSRLLDEKILFFLKELNSFSIKDIETILDCVKGNVNEISKLNCNNPEFKKVENMLLRVD